MSRTWWVFLVIGIILFAITFIAQLVVPTMGDMGWFAILAMEIAGMLSWVVITLLVALFPARGRSYGRRLVLRMPYTFVASMCLLLTVVLFEYRWLSRSGMTVVKDRTYEEISPAVDCSSVHDGVFENEGIIIERSGSSQTQRDKSTGWEQHLRVEWLNDCEYRLFDPDRKTAFLRAKITRVDSSGYDCVYDGQATGGTLCSIHVTRTR